MINTRGDRRSFFRTALGEFAEEFTRRAKKRVSPTSYHRPPGALPELAFLAACTRCGACIEVCPPHAIVHAPANAGLAAHTPMIDPLIQPCTVCEDMPCAKACPTDALNVPQNGWDGAKMGWVELVPERCIVFQGVACGACARACPVGEAALRLDPSGAPVILQEGCIGCGACVRACVTTPPSIILHPKD